MHTNCNSVFNFRLALYVYEYLLHVGAQKAAQTFLNEVRSHLEMRRKLKVSMKMRKAWLPWMKQQRLTELGRFADSVGEEHHTWWTSWLPSLLVVVSSSHHHHCCPYCCHHHRNHHNHRNHHPLTVYSGTYTALLLKEERLATTAVRPRHSMTM